MRSPLQVLHSFLLKKMEAILNVPGSRELRLDCYTFAIIWNLLKAREKSRVHGAIGFGFGFASHWLKNWRESLKPITMRSNRNHVITFDSHLKTDLLAIGSLRIDDYSSTRLFGHVMSPVDVGQKLEFTIISEHDDDDDVVGVRQISRLCSVGVLRYLPTRSERRLPYL